MPRAAGFALLLASICAYADGTVCGSCHTGIAASFAKTGMARSFYPLTPQHAIEDYTKGNPFYHAASGTWYAMERRGGAYYQRRWRIDNNGKEIDVRDVRVDYVMGSGDHARTYLHRTDRGALIELPLAWYSENGGEWAMGPGHDQAYALPPRTVAYECMFCHNSYPQIPAGYDEAGREPLYAGGLPEGIDCQRCHGPGEAHVRAAQTGAELTAIRRSIVNPARLSSERQMEVCLQCHLQTTSRPLPHSMVKYDRGPFSYRPGEPLGDFMIFFDRPADRVPKDEFEIVSSAYRLRQSQCFARSSGKLTCTTCHNPHEQLLGERATARYNAVCGSCHASALHQAIAQRKHTADANCVGCHMPKRRAQDVVRTVMTDHRIQRRPEWPDASLPVAERQGPGGNTYRGEVVQYYPPPDPRRSDDPLYLAVAQVRQGSNLAEGLPRLAAALNARKPVRPEFYIELGQAWLAAGKHLAAIEAFGQAAKLRPGSPVAALNLADATTQAGKPARAVDILTRALATDARNPLLWYQIGISRSAEGQASEAVAAFEKSVGLDPDLTEAHNLLGAALAGAGEFDRAEREIRRALEIHPDYADAQANLGHLLAAQGQLADAEFYFSRAIQLKPADAEIRINYAVTLAGMNRFEAAQQQIDAAVADDPRSPEGHNFRGTLLEHAGKSTEALAEFLEAVRLQPAFGRAHLNAARILAARGDTTAAIAHLRQAASSGEPKVQRQAAEALRQMERH